jgi:hypothetical protein
VSTNLLRKMPVEALYAQIGQLIETMPDLKAMGPLPAETLRWLGRADALVGEAEGAMAQIEFQQHRNTLEQYRQAGAERIAGLLYRALATVETEVPASFAGAFVPAGNTFDAMAAATKIFALAKVELLIVDPYLDEKILTEFAPFVPVGVKLRLLCDAAGNKDKLSIALNKWVQQYSETRPVEARAAPARTLHDRLIAVDRTLVWTVGQSFNALAVRAPTSFVQSNAETATLKVRAYGEDIWNNATVLTA